MALNSTQLSRHALPVLWMTPFFTQCWITERYHQSKKTQFHMLRVTHQKTNNLQKQPPLVSHSEHMRLCLFQLMVSVSYPTLIINMIFHKSQLTFMLTRIHKIIMNSVNFTIPRLLPWIIIAHSRGNYLANAELLHCPPMCHSRGNYLATAELLHCPSVIPVVITLLSQNYCIAHSVSFPW